MAKSMRSKREKRLRAIRRDMVDPFYDKKDAAKLAAQQAALAAPKLPVRPSPFTSNISTMDVASASASTDADSAMGIPFVPSITCRPFFLLLYVHSLGLWISLLWFFISLYENSFILALFCFVHSTHDEYRNPSHSVIQMHNLCTVNRGVRGIET